MAHYHVMRSDTGRRAGRFATIEAARDYLASIGCSPVRGGHGRKWKRGPRPRRADFLSPSPYLLMDERGRAVRIPPEEAYQRALIEWEELPTYTIVEVEAES